MQQQNTRMSSMVADVQQFTRSGCHAQTASLLLAGEPDVLLKQGPNTLPQLQAACPNNNSNATRSADSQTYTCIRFLQAVPAQ
jgi:hypothetical protein